MGDTTTGPAAVALRGAIRCCGAEIDQVEGRDAMVHDIVFCRNVLIYFDKPTQKAVLTRLAGHLRLGGYLVVDHSESMVGAGVPGLIQDSSTVFRRTKDPLP